MSNDNVRPILMTSNSDISMFQKCRRKWNLSSFNRRNLVPIRPNTKLWIGTGCHYALECWHGPTGEDPVVAFRSWAREQLTEIAALLQQTGQVAGTVFNDLQEMIDLGVGLLEHYKDYASRYILPRYEFIATEYEFSVPIPNTMIYLTDHYGELSQWVVDEWGSDYEANETFRALYTDRGLYDATNRAVPALYVGRLDGLVRDKRTGHVFVIDHKFMAALVNPELLMLDSQMSRYIWATNIAIQNGWWPNVEQGTHVGGALYNVIRKKLPKTPTVLQNGTTSKNKNIDTTYEHFIDTLKKRGENPSDFKDVLLEIRAKGNKFFQLEEVERSDDELELVGQRLTWEYNEMSQAAAYSRDVRHPGLYPSPAMDCLWSCAYRSICIVANQGDDGENIISRTMVPQERRDLYATQLEHLE